MTAIDRPVASAEGVRWLNVTDERKERTIEVPQRRVCLSYVYQQLWV
jgi:hypothetical protein